MRILNLIRMFLQRWLGNPFHGLKLSHIEDQDMYFDPDVERMIRECELRDAFRSFGTLEEYNRDFATYFKSHRGDFYLDYSQRDGHFRV
ncbi:MAG TPA: hypothetical protein PLR71_03855 [Deltaproteobacteria bacterium]|nr:hypothetical protein [Deltaproteobacteria bacterium]HQI80674.1 hypothetical protein [Deltaproteobacteria bacterium]